jgi:uncharacterized protein Yka (UPF0111/DUF47 family)
VGERDAPVLYDVQPPRPILSGVGSDAVAMADDADRAMQLLSRATVAFLDPDSEASTVEDTVAEIRELEHRCDERKHAALRTVFAREPTGEALVDRAVLRSLDGVADAVEDAADRLAYLQARTV